MHACLAASTDFFASYHSICFLISFGISFLISFGIFPLTPHCKLTVIFHLYSKLCAGLIVLSKIDENRCKQTVASLP